MTDERFVRRGVHSEIALAAHLLSQLRIRSDVPDQHSREKTETPDDSSLHADIGRIATEVIAEKPQQAA